MSDNASASPGPPQGEGDAGPNAPPLRPRSNPIPHFLFISFMLFLLTNHNGDEFLARHQYQYALNTLTNQLSNYTAWMNGTESNFTVPDQDPTVPPLLQSFKMDGGLLDSHSSYYANSTGTFHGDVALYNITPQALANDTKYDWSPLAKAYMPDANMTSVIRKMGSWNWTASSKSALRLYMCVRGKIELTDETTSEELRLEFEGIHFISNGTMYAFAEPSGRHVDLRLLPSIVPEDSRNDIARIIEPELTSRIVKLRNLIDAGIIEQQPVSDDIPKTSCPFSLYLVLDSVRIPEGLLREFEEEIQRPAGIWTVSPPPLSVSGLLMSKECGMIYEFRNTEGVSLRSLLRKLTTYAGMTALSYLVMQRISSWTFLVQSTVDALSFAGHTVFALVADGKPSLSLIAPAFLACILFANEAQFTMQIQQFQGPEDPPSPAPAPATNTPPTLDGPEIVPAISTSDAPQPTVIPPPTIQTTPLRSWLILFVLLAVMVQTILSATASIFFVALTYSFFWLPQIVRSARRGRGSGLSKEYLVGTTMCRLFIALYFLLCPKNVLDIEPRRWSYLLAMFVCLQVMVVILQDTALGPTFFLPRRYAVVKTYDYHPVMPMPSDDPESLDQSLGDCAICMDAIHVDASLRRRTKSFDDNSDRDKPIEMRKGKRKGRSGTAGGILNAVHMGVGSATGRKNYSLAPCHHLFHTDCLEKWLSIKNICPQCRRPLPPL
ncbi:hypothetical protein C8J57DRAFT_1500270 [Mycena rebaudengoi]|nr:hypothetical protein C8J57DRAFT_1500270 [Mycena rebaudengoi]